MKSYTYIILILLTLSSCTDFLLVAPPKTSLTTSTVFTSEETATAAVVRLYAEMAQYSNTFAAGETSLNNLAGLSADEFLNYNTNYDLEQFSQNTITANNASVLQNWTTLYNYIYSCNAVLEGLEQSSLSIAVKNALTGEVKFMRAFYYFYLINYWGEVPLAVSTDYKVNSTLARSSVDKVYAQIVEDLTVAQELLPTNNSAEKIRPDKAASTALLARVYLYTQQWSKAEQQASQLLDNTNFALETDLNNVFLKASAETIWQLQSVVPYVNTWEGYTFVLRSAPTISSVRPEVAASFDPFDNRQSAWLDQFTDGAESWYYPFKYKIRLLPEATSPKTEYLVIFRLAEQFLIRAEARVQQGNLSGGLEDVNMIRSRSGMVPLSLSDKASLLSAIEEERRKEFFAEWGHRWLDLKRTNRATEVLGAIKANWKEANLLFPIPQQERNRNSQLSQNPGY